MESRANIIKFLHAENTGKIMNLDSAHRFPHSKYFYLWKMQSACVPVLSTGPFTTFSFSHFQNVGSIRLEKIVSMFETSFETKFFSYLMGSLLYLLFTSKTCTLITRL